MKKIMTVALTALIFCSISTANAENDKNTVSVGYAHTAVSGFLSGNVLGINLKYHWEDLDSGLGVIASTSYNEMDITNIDGGKVKLGTFLLGPSYRFNEYFTLYAMAGAANAKYESNIADDDQTKFTYGLGFQVNPANNWAIDASYQYAKFNTAYDSHPHVDTGTWVLGVGYSF